ncbi:MAG: Isoleucine-tRNA ligase [Candidatus Woesebacteria bacterium GW2011_GWB1_39_12]|uniref:Isoleucine--tRNA ligase n=1 Tax=Candidatus Woesebacteria bacterium GW2011_GWB1_39_12 TaxID=1618574 RepID=A0A0G0QE25_9BACT|nr:MAG: Isoleucine-tRNA ligase [Candidatus Woesebacteria bacterium GW2011_GWB1_39_12]
MNVNLPKTDFPMRPSKDVQSNVPVEMGHQSSEADTFVVLDGPIYSNGDVHMGHTLNKVLKDFVVRHKLQMGQSVEFRPGFDNHGLPIEVSVEKQLRKNGQEVSSQLVRSECRKFAQHWVDVQTESFKKMGVMADWDNPYLTMSAEYEAKEVEAFGELYLKGYLFQDDRVVPWSPNLGTALADSELEYQDVEDDSVYVKFEFDDDPASSVMVWTTTPWTLVANKAVAFNPEMQYAKLAVQGTDGNKSPYVWVSTPKVDEVVALLLKNGLGVEKWMDCSRTGDEVFSGRQLISPLTGEKVPLLPADWVDDKQGTGLVHVAPGFGEDDFSLGKQHGMEAYCPMDNRCHWTESVPADFVGKKCLSSNDLVFEKLKGNHTFLMSGKFKHSYPFDERLHQKVVYRVSRQWFMDLDHDNLRDRVVQAVDKMQWSSSVGHDNVVRMVQSRPSWCLSRQKAWGVGVPVFYHKETGNLVADETTFRAVAEMTRKHSSDGWFNLTPEEMLPSDYVDPKTGATPSDLVKEESTLSVWFDSALANLFVKGWAQTDKVLDFALEGQDQIGSWFQVSLLLSVALTDKVPYNFVLSHGFVLDKNGNAMHKSAGNVVSPEYLVQKYNMDSVRLWTALCDLNRDVRVGDVAMDGVKVDYLLFRNFFRFCLGNLTGEVDTLAQGDALDGYFKLRCLEMASNSKQNYERYAFSEVVREAKNFVLEMNGFYFDSVKDTLYCENMQSEKAKAVRSNLYTAMVVMLKVLQPVMPFLCQEVCDCRSDLPSMACSLLWGEYPSLDEESQSLFAEFQTLAKFRSVMKKAQEEYNHREGKVNPLEMGALVFARPEEFEVLRKYQKYLAQWWVVSQVEVRCDGAPRVCVSLADGEKCARCWTRNVDCQQVNDQHLCPRCRTEEVIAN